MTDEEKIEEAVANTNRATQEAIDDELHKRYLEAVDSSGAQQSQKAQLSVTEKKKLPPEIVKIGTCELIQEGVWRVSGWAFDFTMSRNSDKPVTLYENTFAGFTCEELHEISVNRHLYETS